LVKKFLASSYSSTKVPTVREAVDTLVEEYEEAKNFLTKKPA
jgi:hypothetical protein